MPFYWKNPSNNNMSDSDWGTKSLMMHYTDTDSEYKDILILINMERNDVSFTLPAGRSWELIVDTQHYFDDEFLGGMSITDASRSYNIQLENSDEDTAFSPVGEEHTVKASSIVILEEQ